MLIHDDGWAKNKKEGFINLFLDFFNINKGVLVSKTEISMKLIRINGILWAAMNSAKSKKNQKKQLDL